MFPETLNEVFWTSSIDTKYPVIVWVVNFNNGMSGFRSLIEKHAVRCVR